MRTTNPSSRLVPGILTAAVSAITLAGSLVSREEESNGLAPVVTDLNAADVPYALEAKLPDLQKRFLDPSPAGLDD